MSLLIVAACVASAWLTDSVVGSGLRLGGGGLVGRSVEWFGPMSFWLVICVEPLCVVLLGRECRTAIQESLFLLLRSVLSVWQCLL